jgi:LytS/YehU family sensor histidine kinase
LPVSFRSANAPAPERAGSVGARCDYSRGLIADREAAAQAAQRQAAESRLRLLEAQLEPHMFFNTLANLHVLIGLDPPRAQAMLDQLISFLRATLSSSQAVVHPLPKTNRCWQPV